MKKLYSSIMVFAMMIAALGFTACSSDDDSEDGYNSSSLVGTWELVSGEGWGLQSPDDGVCLVQFKKDGTYILLNVYPDEEETTIDRGTWKVVGNGLVITMEDEDIENFTLTYEILELKSDKLVLTFIGLIGNYKRVSDSVMDKYLRELSY